MSEIKDEVVTEIVLRGVDVYVRNWERVNTTVEGSAKTADALNKELSRLMIQYDRTSDEVRTFALRIDKAKDQVVLYTAKLKKAKERQEEATKEYKLAEERIKKLTGETVVSKDYLASYSKEIEDAEQDVRDYGQGLMYAENMIREFSSELQTAKSTATKLEGEIENGKKQFTLYGKAVDESEDDVEKFDESIKKTRTTSGKLSSFLKNTLSRTLSFYLANAFRDVTRYVGRAIGRMAEFVGSTSSAAIEFESLIVRLSNVASTESIEDLSKVALQLGKDTKLVAVSAEDAATGLTELYKAGLDDVTIFGPDGMQGVLNGTSREIGAFKAASDLAATSNLDFIQTSGLASTTLAIYGGHLVDSTEKAQFLTDSFNYMVLTANSSRAEVSDFDEALKGVGPTAYELNIPLETVIDTLAILADNGIKGATAGTQLRQMLSNMTRTTPKVTEALSALNIDLWDAEGNFRNLEDIVGDFNTAFYETGVSTVFVSDATAEQNDLFDKAIKQYDDAEEKLYAYNQGLTELSGEEIDNLTEAQARAVVVMDEYASIGGEYMEVERALTEREVNTALLDIFGSRGRNTAAALFTDTSLAIDKQAISTENLNLANAELVFNTDELGSAYEELRKKQQTAIDLEDQVQKIIDSTAGKKEILDSIMESYKLGFGSIFIELLGKLYSSLSPLMDELLPSIMEQFEEWGDILGDLGDDKLPTLVDWIGNKAIPALLNFGTWLMTDGLESALAFGEWIQTHIIDNLVKLYEWIDTDGREMWNNFYKWLKTDGKEAFDAFVAYLNDEENGLIPTLKILYTYITTDLKDALVEYYGIIRDDIVPRLEDWDTGNGNIVESTQELVDILTANHGKFGTFLDFLGSVSGLIFDIEMAYYRWIISMGKADKTISDDSTIRKLYEEVLPLLIEWIDKLSAAIRGGGEGVTAGGVVLAWLEFNGAMMDIIEDVFPVFYDNIILLSEEYIPALGQKVLDIIEKLVEWHDYWGILGDMIDIFMVEVIEKAQEKFDAFKESITTAIDDIMFLIDALLSKITGMPTSIPFPDVGLPESAWGGDRIPSSAGSTSTTNNTYNYYTQSNTVNATTSATPQQLSSVFNTISYRSI